MKRAHISKNIVITIISLAVFLAVIIVIVFDISAKVRGVEDGSVEVDVAKAIKEANYAFSSAQNKDSGGTVFFGDSITELFDLHEFFEGKVYNRGIIGDYTARAMRRVESNVNVIRPDTIVYLLGANDLGREYTIDEIIANSRIILDKFRQTEGVKIVMHAVIPVNEVMTPHAKKMVGVRTNENILLLNSALKSLAEEENCIWVDYTDKLKDENGRLRANFTADGLHLTPEAYAIAADALRVHL